MEKKIIGIDISDKQDVTIIFVTFGNDGRYELSNIDRAISYEGKQVGTIVAVQDDYVIGKITDENFYREYLYNKPRESVSFEIVHGGD